MGGGHYRVLVGGRVVVGGKLVPLSPSEHGWVSRATVLGDRWSESGGAGARKQDRVFLL